MKHSDPNTIKAAVTVLLNAVLALVGSSTDANRFGGVAIGEHEGSQKALNATESETSFQKPGDLERRVSWIS